MRSAPAQARSASAVIEPGLPAPTPSTVTFFSAAKPNLSASMERHSETLTPSSARGRRTTTGVTPRDLAARIFSGKPPVAPVSFVTR